METTTGPSNATTEDGPSKIFADVVFHIVLSESLPANLASTLTTTLTSHGATAASPLDSHIRIDLLAVTHIISATVDFPGYAESERYMIPVVTPEWVDVSIRKRKAAHIKPYNPDPRFFFSGVNATSAELPEGDKDSISGAVNAMGGLYSNVLTRFTTHVAALNIDNDKCRQALSKKLKVKLVLPHWFDDCLKLARRIPEGPYLLPDPEIMRVPSSAPVPLPVGPDLSYAHDRSLPTSGGVSQDPPTPRSNFSAFDGKSVLLAGDLGVSLRLRGVLCEIIQAAGGAIVSKVEDANVLVCQWRRGDEYRYAIANALEVGNLTWLYWIFAHSTWASPLRRLLHFPKPPGGVPGMQDMIITVSNYGGDARLYLESLVEACGARFTKSMKVENTHLITAREHSDKCTAAREWNIHMVNHLWLEECYAKGVVCSVSGKKYGVWPPRTNLMEVVGMTSVDIGVIERAIEEEGDGEVEMEDADADQVDEEEREEDEEVVKSAKKLAIAEKVATAAQTETPTRRRWSRDLETPTSVTSSGRKAKEQAAARLHDSVMPDVLKYQQELKRKGGVLGIGRKRRTGSLEGSAENTEDEGAGRVGAKKAKTVTATKRVKPTVFLLLTAYKVWVDNPAKEESDKRGLAALGIQCVNDPSICTHLAAPHIVRTEKFCCALARAPIIVSTSWINACLSSSSIADTTPHLLVDPAGEAKLNIALSESLGRARENKGRLLEGQTIYCAPGVYGGFDTYRRIVEANGGVCIAYRMGKKAGPESEKWVLISSDEAGDRRLWKAWRRMVAEAGREGVVVKTDWLLDAAMGQRVVWSGRYELEG